MSKCLEHVEIAKAVRLGDTRNLDADAIRDLISDAEQSERQAEQGPFYPENGVTREMCLAYAARCWAAIERFKDGGAHAAVLSGRY